MREREGGGAADFVIEATGQVVGEVKQKETFKAHHSGQLCPRGISHDETGPVRTDLRRPRAAPSKRAMGNRIGSSLGKRRCATDRPARRAHARALALSLQRFYSRSAHVGTGRVSPPTVPPSTHPFAQVHRRPVVRPSRRR